MASPRSPGEPEILSVTQLTRQIKDAVEDRKSVV